MQNIQTDPTTDAARPQPRWHDLAAVSGVQAREELPTRALGVATGLVFGGGGLYLLFTPVPGVQGSVGLELVWGFLFVVGLLTASLVVVLFPREQVRGLSIGPSGVEIVYMRRPTRTISWSAPGKRVVLEDWQSVYARWDRNSKRTGMLWTNPGIRPFDLTPAAFDELISAARGAGWKVQDSQLEDQNASFRRVLLTS